VALAPGVLGDDSQTVDSARNYLAHTLGALAGRAERRGDFPAALRFQRDLRKLQAERFGPDEWQTRNAELEVARLDRVAHLDGPGRLRYRAAEDAVTTEVLYAYRAAKQWDAARAAVRGALTTFRELLGPESHRVAYMLHWLADVEELSGDHAEADRHFREADELELKVLGASHPDRAALLQDHGRSRLAAGDEPRAETLMRRAVRLRERAHGKGSAECRPPLEELSGLLEKRAYRSAAAEDFPAAARTEDEVRAILAVTVGEGHYRTRNAQLLVEYWETLAGLDAPKRDRLIETEGLSQESNRLWGAGRFSEAIAAAEESLRARAEILGEDHPYCATLLHSLGGLRHATADFAQAVKDFRRALEIRREKLGNQHLLTAETLNSLGWSLQQSGEPGEARPLHEEAAGIYRAVTGENHLGFANSRSYLGMALQALGKLDEAGTCLNDAIRLRKALLGEENPGVALELNNLAVLQQARKEYSQAEATFQKALAIYRKAPERNATDYALVLCNLGELELKLPRTAAAEPLLSESLELYRKALGEEHPSTTRAYRLLATAYANMQESPRARVFAQRAEEAARVVQRAGTAAPGAALTSVGGLYFVAKDYRKAEGPLRRALEERTRLLGPKDPLTVTARRNLAALLEQWTWSLVDEGDLDRARAAAEEALTLAADVYGAADWRVTSLRLNRDQVDAIAKLDPGRRADSLAARRLAREAGRLERDGRLLEAIPLLTQSLEKEEGTLGKTRGYATLARWLGYSLHRVADYPRAERLLRDSLATVEPWAGDNHPDLALSLNALGVYLLERQRYEEAEPLYRRALAVSERVGNKNTLEHAWLLTQLGWIEHKLRSNFDEAESLYTQSRDLRLSLVGDRHPDYADSLTYFATLARDREDYATAEALFAQAERIMSTTLPESDTNYINALNDLGVTRSRRNDAAGAVTLLRRIIAIRERAHGRTSVRTRESLGNLAKMLNELGAQQVQAGQFPAAVAARSEAIAVLLELHDPHDWRVTDARLALARTHRIAAMTEEQRGRLAQAERWVQEGRRLEKLRDYGGAADVGARALEALHDLFGDRDREYVLELGWQARYLRLAGDFERAQPLIRRGAELARDLFGVAHPLYADAVSHRITVAVGLGDLDGAESLAQELVQCREFTEGRESARAAQARDRLDGLTASRARALVRAGEIGRARAALGELLARRTAEFGPDDWRAIDARVDLDDLGRRDVVPPALREALDQADLDRGRVVELLASGDVWPALGPATLAERGYREALGEDSRSHLLAMNELATVFRGLRQWRRAAAQLDGAAAVAGGLLGPRHPTFARLLTDRAVVAARLGEDSRARDLLARARPILRARVGASHRDSVRARDALRDVLLRQAARAEAGDDLAAARGLRRDLLALLTEAHGVANWRVTEGRLALKHVERLAAMDADRRGRLAGIIAESRGPDGPPRGGVDREALTRLRGLAEEVAQALGPDDVAALDAFGRFALAADRYGERSEAEPELIRYVGWSERLRGRYHPLTAAAMTRLGENALALGESPRALAAFRQAAAIARQAAGEASAEHAAALEGLGRAHDALGQLERSEEALRRAAAILRTPDPARCAAVLSALAKVVDARGDSDQAEEIHRQALSVADTALIVDDSAFAPLLADLAELHYRRGRYAEAASQLREAIEIDPDGARGIEWGEALCRYELAAGNAREAEVQLRRVTERLVPRLATASALSERAQLRVHESLRNVIGLWLALAHQGRVGPEEAYRVLLAWKGHVFAEQRGLRQARNQPELVPLIDELERTTSRLAYLASVGPPPGGHEAWQDEINRLEQTMGRLDAELKPRSAPFRRQREIEAMTPERIAGLLPDGVVFVDYVEHEAFRPDAAGGSDDPRRLSAFVLRPGGPVLLLDLAPAGCVGRAVLDWRRTFGAGLEGADAAARLRDLVLPPELLQHLAGAETVLVSPDGDLARFPIGALPGAAPGSYVIEELPIAVIPTPRLLPEILGESPRPMNGEADGANPSLLLVGDVRFGGEPARVRRADRGVARAAVRGPNGSSFDPLPATEVEVAEVAEMFRATYTGASEPLTLRDSGATEQAFRQSAPRYEFIHLATHGFFSPKLSASGGPRPPDEAVSGAANDPGPLPPLDLTEVHPGLLSGVALAGANRGARAAADDAKLDDGILTALEVAEFDLTKARLVVLSACETGLGTIVTGEGVLGLQRGFHVAGAGTLVISLWNVGDDQTRVLMRHFYENLWQRRMSKLEALRQAQIAMLRGVPAEDEAGHGLERITPAGDRRTPPWVWAAWTLSGDWR
jgi:CHAT domain-containing protein/tetratricopeptide (TPR) repeat protein